MAHPKVGHPTLQECYDEIDHHQNNDGINKYTVIYAKAIVKTLYDEYDYSFETCKDDLRESIIIIDVTDNYGLKIEFSNPKCIDSEIITIIIEQPFTSPNK